MEDFEYRGYIVLYASHPKLCGDWEIWKASEQEDFFITRAISENDAKRTIDMRFVKLDDGTEFEFDDELNRYLKVYNKPMPRGLRTYMTIEQVEAFKKTLLN